MKLKAVTIIVCIMLLIPVVDSVDSGYFQILRLVVCSFSIFCSVKFYKNERLRDWLWFFVPNAVLFNPIFQFKLDHGLWQIVDIAVVIIFVLAFRQLGKINKKIEPEQKKQTENPES